MLEFRNESGLEFTDISNELERTYFFPQGVEVTIELPQFLYVDDYGYHLVLDADGVVHSICPEWFHLAWEAKEGAPHVTVY